MLAGLEARGQTGAAPPAGSGDDRLAGWRALLPPGAEAPRGPSAVLVPLFEEDGEAWVILTRRSAALRTHRGQVSFPGGHLDPGEDAAEAALRESLEEVALDPGSVVPAGWLHPLFTLDGSSLVLPVVGTLSARPVLAPNPAEVARVFDVRLAELLADGAFREETWDPFAAWAQGEALPRQLWYFGVAGERVWGATARILHELLVIALGLDVAAA